MEKKFNIVRTVSRRFWAGSCYLFKSNCWYEKRGKTRKKISLQIIAQEILFHGISISTTLHIIHLDDDCKSKTLKTKKKRRSKNKFHYILTAQEITPKKKVRAAGVEFEFFFLVLLVLHYAMQKFTTSGFAGGRK